MRDGIGGGHVGMRRRVAHEAAQLAIDQRIEVDAGVAGHAAAQPERFVFRDVADARTAFSQRGRHGVELAAEAGRQAHAGNDDAMHQKPSTELKRPTRRSLAT